MTPPRLIAITDAGLSDEELKERATRILSAVPRGDAGIQLRDKRRSSRALLALAEELQSICARFGAPLYINDRVDVAQMVGAAGVHLGGTSIEIADARRVLGAEAFVSVAAHELSDVDRAAREGATAALVSPIFATPGKGVPRGVGFVSEARALAPHLFIYALGGIDVDRAHRCVEAGADGVAVVRAAFGAVDIANTAGLLVAARRNPQSTG